MTFLKCLILILWFLLLMLSVFRLSVVSRSENKSLILHSMTSVVLGFYMTNMIVFSALTIPLVSLSTFAWGTNVFMMMNPVKK